MPRQLALTISPRSRVEYFNRFPKPQRAIYDEDALTIKMIMKYNKIKNYIIYPEFDEKGRLHYHGIVTLNATEYTRWCRHAHPKLSRLGHIDFTELKTFKNLLRYTIYMSKNWGISKDILELNHPMGPLSIASAVGGARSAKCKPNDLDHTPCVDLTSFGFTFE